MAVIPQGHNVGADEAQMIAVGGREGRGMGERSGMRRASGGKANRWVDIFLCFCGSSNSSDESVRIAMRKK